MDRKRKVHGGTIGTTGRSVPVLLPPAGGEFTHWKGCEIPRHNLGDGCYRTYPIGEPGGENKIFANLKKYGR